ncbi:MAG TPA: hypothetical protein VD788_12620 [Candidatus Polarisedimenticolaceae bacterium]|nr:hypothetical protein [Candidatus Polarisedimenticolaceae bacterium]
MTTNATSRHHERGEGRVGFLITLIVAAVLIFVGAKVIPVRITAYEFRDALREEARYGAVRNTDALVAQRIMDKAAELEIPLKKTGLTVQRTQSQMVIKAQYEQPIDLKVMTYVYKFDVTEKAPLF